MQFILLTCDSSVTSSAEDQGELHQARVMQLAVMGTFERITIYSPAAGVLLFLYVINAVMRFWSAEVFAFGFHLVHLAGHIILLINVVHQFDPSAFVYVYALLLVWGMPYSSWQGSLRCRRVNPNLVLVHAFR